ncbi:hypothetical protein RCL_jg10347.t1 [Rhizophagus clarus]|uniref:Uncharacterized protein n=1 Tax=Rhizophagus clarus TaxID=94130 RepID=A0A8H3QF66_9GLOM|nr:hypothetical protein RCL_jg10347.t1 [Rhizophagus clarus]
MLSKKEISCYFLPERNYLALFELDNMKHPSPSETLSYDEEFPTRWFQGTWKVKDIKEFTQHKAYKRILVDVNNTNMRAYCKEIHNNHKVICTKVLKVGDESFVEVTFTNKEEMIRTLDKEEKGLDNTSTIIDKDKNIMSKATEEKSNTPTLIKKTSGKNVNLLDYINNICSRMQPWTDTLATTITPYILYRNSDLKGSLDDVNKRKKFFEETIKEFNLAAARLLDDSNEHGFTYVEAYFKTKEEMEKALKIVQKATWLKWEDKLNMIGIEKPPIESSYEFHQVNESCRERLEAKIEEDQDVNNHNKRKKNHADTLYRTKFGAKSAKED